MQADEHVDDNNVHEVFQSVCKVCHSAETALLLVKNNINLALDNNHAAFLNMLDLSAAFDTIVHQILFQHFEYDFGIKGTALDWFKSYLSGRTLLTLCFKFLVATHPLSFWTLSTGYTH